MRDLQVSNTGDVSAEDTRRATKVATKATAEELAALTSFVAYEVRLFSNNAYTRLATSTTVTFDR